MARNQIRSVQLLRVAAFLLVFVSHCFPDLSYAGACGVSVFLVLSGFLSYQHRGHEGSVPGFVGVVKRALGKASKFYPVHIVTLIASLPLVMNGVSGPDGMADFPCKLVAQVLLVHSWIPIRSFYFSCNAVSWYLSTFLFIVLLEPYMIRLVTAVERRGLGPTLLLTIGCVALGGAISLLSVDADSPHWICYVCPLSRCVDVLVGMLGASLLRDVANKPGRCIALSCVACAADLALLHYLVGKDPDHPVFYACAWYIPSTLLVVGIAGLDGSMKRFLDSAVGAFFVGLGNAGLELFMWHQLVIRYVKQVDILQALRDVAPLGWFCIALGLSIACALMWKRVYELLSTRINQRLAYRGR